MFQRLYTGDDGQSHLEDLDLDGANVPNWKELQEGTGIMFRSTSPDAPVTWHVAPRKQYCITLSGQGRDWPWRRQQALLRPRRRDAGRGPHRAGFKPRAPWALSLAWWPTSR